MHLHDLTLRDQLASRDRLHRERCELLDQKKRIEQEIAEKDKRVKEIEEEIRTGMMSRKMGMFVCGDRIARLESGAFGDPKRPYIYFETIHVIPEKDAEE